MPLDLKEVAVGAIFIGVGVLYGAVALATLPMGDLLDMGPGYFPIVLSGLLVAFGLILIGRGFFYASDVGFGVVAWRAIAMLSIAAITFALTLYGLGLFLAVFLTTLLASLSAPGPRLSTRVATSVAISIFCVLVFWVGIGLRVPLVGRWLPGGY